AAPARVAQEPAARVPVVPARALVVPVQVVRAAAVPPMSNAEARVPAARSARTIRGHRARRACRRGNLC
ncbi:hypothetical protein, partial [Rhodopseudomonas sp. AAP120]|uniref:hypothetical protein n=1 Tax=Rhodopseudomonas sp. AAP120 TaxID=1523430 RepID=UPI001AEBCE52